MPNDAPDSRALAVYETWARTRAMALTVLNGKVADEGSEELAAQIAIKRIEARRSIHVMEALATAWHRDAAERERIRQEAQRRFTQLRNDLMSR